jgi:hypothetical protein
VQIVTLAFNLTDSLKSFSVQTSPELTRNICPKIFLLNGARAQKIYPVQTKIFLLVHQQNSSFLTVPSLKRNFCSSRGIILIYSSIPQGWKESLSGFISQKREQIPSQTLEQNGAGVRQTL